jgi:CBS domain-containing protein
MTTAAELVTGPAIEVRTDTNLRRFSELLEENGIGAALVRAQGGGIAGVISERDVVRALAEGADPDNDRVGDYMSFDVEFVSGATPVASVAAAMLDGAIRHLPVADPDGRVIGVLSIRDVLAAVDASTGEVRRT